MNTILCELQTAAEQAARRLNEDGEINYPYMAGLLTGALRTIAILATTGGTAEEVRDAIKYETTLFNNYNRKPQQTWSFDSTKLSLI